MEMLGIETSREQVLNLISDIDKDGNGDIDFDEFLQVRSRSYCFEVAEHLLYSERLMPPLQVMAAGQSLPYSKQLMIKNFSTFRKTKPEAPPGMIHVKDLRTALVRDADISDASDRAWANPAVVHRFLRAQPLPTLNLFARKRCRQPMLSMLVHSFILIA